jgi:hypothetical protein
MKASVIGHPISHLDECITLELDGPFLLTGCIDHSSPNFSAGWRGARQLPLRSAWGKTCLYLIQ